jgi:hypothetical protein
MTFGVGYSWSESCIMPLLYKKKEQPPQQQAKKSYWQNELDSLGIEPKQKNELNDDEELENLADIIKQAMFQDYKVAYSEKGDELEEAEGFIANGIMDSTLYTINGNWKSIGNWSMNVADGELMNFTTTMSWYNGTAGHTHEFLNFEADDDGVDISADDQTISVAGTMDVGTNGAVAWEDVPSEIVIQGGEIISVSVDNEATDEHFSGQSVHGNVTSLTVCSTTPGPAMQVSPTC